MATATIENPASPQSTPLQSASLESAPLESDSYSAGAISFEEFVAAPQFYGRRVEWVDGEVIEKMSVSLNHSLLVVFLATLLKMVAEANGGRVLADQFLMRLEEQSRGREPDILYVAPANESRLLRNYLDGPADLAIEVVSPGSEAVDRGAKFEEYEAGGVREYWLLDPHRREALFYLRDEASGLFRPGVVRDGVFVSQVLPVVQLRVEWLWEQPPILEILRGWNLI